MNTLTINLLSTVDRFVNNVRPVNAAINMVVDRIAPVSIARACHGGIVCFQWCEWTDYCCGNCLGTNQQRFYSIALPGHSDCSQSAVCAGGCGQGCGACGGCA